MHFIAMDDIVKETLRMASKTQLSVSDICEKAKIKPRWYYKFTSGGFSDPGVNKVMRLNRALKSAIQTDAAA